jgi:hypothetical protein
MSDFSNSDAATIADHAGKYYLSVLGDIHKMLRPKAYFEIGTNSGNSLALAECGSVAVDPQFALVDSNIMKRKSFCYLFQMTSDDFFFQYTPRHLFGRPIDLAFLDGMHRCEYLLRDFANTERNCASNSIIAMHDCLPVEVPMADRAFSRPPIEPRRAGWWTGDVWRTLLALKKWRPDLSIYAFDAPPTGLVLITDLGPDSTVIGENYKKIVEEMLSYDLEKIGIPDFFNMADIMSTSVIDTHEKLSRLFWL